MKLELWQSCYVLFPLLVLLHLHVAPYTKVEESFNIQAIHDIIEYGVPLSDVRAKFDLLFDHMKFPGSVPRTFIGALVTAVVARPSLWLCNIHDGLLTQETVRGTVGILNAAALIVFASSVRRAFGSTTALYYTLFQASQFHIWYYASRTLPNMFAFSLSTLSLTLLLPQPTLSLGPVKRVRLAFYLLSLATIIFRAELSLLVGAHALYILLQSPTLATRLALIKNAMLPSLISGVLISLILTITIDTYFWQSSIYLWPELSAFLFNIFPPEGSGGASDWGTSPWYWYWTNALPRLMMGQYPLLLLCVLNLTDRAVKDILTPNVLFVVLYSVLSHKETRFLFSIVPPFTLLAALVATRYHNNFSKSMVAKGVVAFSIVGAPVMMVLSHAILLPLSAQNYPGGHALKALHEYHSAHYEPLHYSEQNIAHTTQARIHVYLTNLALQSGITRFLEQPILAPSATASQVQTDAPPKQYEMIKGKVVEVPQHAYQVPRHDVRSSKFEPLTVQVVPGQKPLTIYPQDPQASASSAVETNARQITTNESGIGSPNHVWTYDKSQMPDPNANGTAELARFWSRFTYAIVESPCSLLMTNLSFTIDEAIYALGPLKFYRSHEPRRTHGPSLLQAMYGQRLGGLLSSLSSTAHDTLRHTLLKGYWLELSHAPKLYIVDFTLNQSRERIQAAEAQMSLLCPSPTHPPSHSHYLNKHTQTANEIDSDALDLELQQPTLLLPADSDNDHSNSKLNFNTLGPLVVNKDGSLSRLDNWAAMTEQEREKVIAFLRKRNKLRLDDEQQ